MLRFRRASDLEGAGSIRVWARTTPHFRAELEQTADPEERNLPVAEALRARYRRLGEGFLDGLKGGFAIALHDPSRALALLARDGMGHESLAYSLTDEDLAAAWNEEDLVGTAGVTGELDRSRLAEFYANCELSSTRTLFAGARVVAPAEMILVEKSTVRQRTLSKPNLDLRLRLSCWEEYVERFAELFRQAVDRNVADCDRVGVLLSGGLDSSPIAARARRALSTRTGRADAGEEDRVVALSWRLSDAATNEQSLVEAVVAHCGLDLEWIDCDDAGPFLPLDSWPVHPATPEQTPYRWFHQRAYERAAERGCGVVLTGFSGDSLYGNARGWAWDLLRDRGLGVTMDRLRECARETSWPRTLRSQLLSPLLPRSRGLRETYAPYLTASARELLTRRSPYPPDIAVARRPRQARRVLALLDAHGGQVERYYTAPLGIDARTPLRDFDLAQFLLASPAHLLQQGLETRPVLREAIRGWVPEEVRRRRDKASFYEIVERGLERVRRTWARRLLESPDALWRGLVEPRAVENWITAPLDRGWDTSGLLHVIYGELWRLKRSGVDLGSLET